MARKGKNKGKLVASETIPVGTGQQTPEEARHWAKTQVPYENYAGRVPELDEAVKSFASSRRSHFHSHMAGPMKRWAVNWSAANTEVMWHEREDDVHRPETKKALDGKVARIEEAVTGFDPVFEAEGTKGDVSRRTAKVLGNYIYRQMEMADWKSLVQPVARNGELCNVLVAKVQWEKRIESVIERIDEPIEKDGKLAYKTKRVMSNKVVQDGISIQLVDPFLFIYDLEARKADECAYIGDESDQFLHDLERMADMGTFSRTQVDKLKDRDVGRDLKPNDGTTEASIQDQLRRSRSIATNSDFSHEQESKHGASRIRVLELWAWFDFGDGYDGVTSPTGERLTGVRRVVITVAGDTVIRFQENPFDRKFVPYAFELVNRNGHELVAPAPFDAVVQSNAEYDRLSSNIARWMDLSVSPVIVTSDINTDLPDTILDVEAGSVLKNAGQWDWIKVPDITNAISYQQQFHRREIEELSGNLRVFESPQGTATETERKVQEQQRMVRNSIRANGNFWRQVAHLAKAYEGQFSTGVKRFRVAGKASSLLGDWAEITPDMLHEEVDFRFLGLTDVHVFGNRLQGMSQWMNRWGPVLGEMPEINKKAICRLDFELSVGRSQTSEIFPSEAAPWEAWDQKEENAMLSSGQHVEVHDADDDEQHLQEMMPLLKRLEAEDAPNYVLAAVREHLSAHMEALERKEQEQAAMQKKADQTAQLMAPSGGQPGVDRPPVAGGMQAPSQQADVTPGSPQARTASRTGRGGSGMSQTQVMQ